MPVSSSSLGGLWRRVRHRIGRRGAFLLALFLLDTGNAARLTWPSRETLASPTVQFLSGVAPLPLWGAAWGAVGALCLIQAFMTSDRVAFTSASALKVAWALVHVGAWLAGVAQAWWSAVIWLVMAGVVHVIATWPEHPDAVGVPDPPGGDFDRGPGSAGQAGGVGA
jgi:hypothetical protein